MLYIYIYIYSSCYSSIPLTSVFIGRDGGLSSLCHSCRFNYQQRVLKTFPGPGYLHSLRGWGSLTIYIYILHIYIYIYIYIYMYYVYIYIYIYIYTCIYIIWKYRKVWKTKPNKNVFGNPSNICDGAFYKNS